MIGLLLPALGFVYLHTLPTRSSRRWTAVDRSALCAGAFAVAGLSSYSVFRLCGVQAFRPAGRTQCSADLQACEADLKVRTTYK